MSVYHKVSYGSNYSMPVAGELRVNPTDNAEVVWIPKGKAIIEGTLIAEFDNHILETSRKQQKLEVDGFWMYKRPVTVLQYLSFLKAMGIIAYVDTHDKVNIYSAVSKYRNESGKCYMSRYMANESVNLPKTGVTWDMAMAYAHWAQAVLPTELEWKRAARADHHSAYPWGDQWDDNSQAVHIRSTLREFSDEFEAGASPFGVLDMIGNIAEWCLSVPSIAGYSSIINRFQGCRTRFRGSHEFNDYRVICGGYVDRAEYGYGFQETHHCRFSAAMHLNQSQNWIGFRCIVPKEYTDDLIIPYPVVTDVDALRST